MNVIRRHLASPAMIVACAALIVALGGVSYAAAVLPKNSVGTAQLQKNAVTRAKLKRNTVTTAKVKNGSLLAADFKAGQLPAGLQGSKGEPGPQGPKGDEGDAGAAGSPGLSGLEIVRDTTTGPYASQDATATCPDGKRAIAVSGRAEAPLGTVALTRNQVINEVWNGKHISAGSVNAQTIGGNAVGTWTLTAIVTCAHVQ